jgi:hypothetical protein
MAKRFLTKAEILTKQDLKTEDVFIPEWDAWITVRSMSASQRDKFEAGTIERNGKEVRTNLENIRARLCVLCMVGEDGEQLFDEADDHALGLKSAAALQRVFEVAQRLNGMREEDVNELAANFPADQNGDSPSD